MTIAAPMRVTALARKVGVKPDTVRFYERIGLLPANRRSASNHRPYDASAVDRIRFIQGAQRLGLRLADIKVLLDVRDTGKCPCEPAELLLARRLAEIDQEMAKLSRLRADLARFLEHNPGDDCPDPVPGTWCPREEVHA
jgi:DNA-binding transcriptional MerR regulator